MTFSAPSLARIERAAPSDHAEQVSRYRGPLMWLSAIASLDHGLGRQALRRYVAFAVGPCLAAWSPRNIYYVRGDLVVFPDSVRGLRLWLPSIHEPASPHTYDHDRR